ncbi:hypothetical protein [Microbacterium alcoholitolerans]|uniref:hypothetical protein n=1 Tax=unclassified Microbacterium TaxID=2609290 RepID=UPI003D181D0E
MTVLLVCVRLLFLLSGGFEARLLEAGCGDDLRDALRSQIVVEFREDPDASSLGFAIAALTAGMTTHA